MVLFCSILSNREERSLLEKDISKTKILLIALMRDVVSLYLLVRLRNSVFLSYSPNIAVSFMSMARTALTPLTQYIAYDEDRKWSTSLSLFRKDWYQWPHELLFTNSHNELGPFTPTGQFKIVCNGNHASNAKNFN